MARYIFILLLLVGVGFGAYVVKERNQKYRPYKTSLFLALKHNEFGRAYVADEDVPTVRKAFAFLDEEKTQRGKVLALVDWINTNTKGDEQWTVDAAKILGAKAAACEIHALAVAALEVHGIRGRWIAGVRSSIGFGYLEAHVDGRWEAFVLRNLETKTTSVSAWELYRTKEPDLSIRMFYPRPGERLTSWQGPLSVGLLPFENVKAHPELEPVFKTDAGLDVRYADFDPYDYVYDWHRHADTGWLQSGEVWAKLQARREVFRFKRRRWLGRLIDAVDGSAPELGPVVQ